MGYLGGISVFQPLRFLMGGKERINDHTAHLKAQGMLIAEISARYPNGGILLVAALFLLYGAGVSIWAFVDFIRILTGGLTPADGSAYTENGSARIQVVQTAAPSSANADALDKLINVLEKLAKLHEQGILTDEEFQQKKTDLLARM